MLVTVYNNTPQDLVENELLLSGLCINIWQIWWPADTHNTLDAYLYLTVKDMPRNAADHTVHYVL